MFTTKSQDGYIFVPVFFCVITVWGTLPKLLREIFHNVAHAVWVTNLYGVYKLLKMGTFLGKIEHLVYQIG